MMKRAKGETMNVISRKTPVTYTLIAINVIVYVLLNVLGMQGGFFDYFVPITTVNAFDGSLYPYITSMFMHGGLMHLCCNMLSLYYIGTVLEPMFGSGKYTIIYLLSGIAGGLVYAAWNLCMGIPTSAVGASGAVFGLFGAYGAVLISEARAKQPKIFMEGVTARLLPPYFSLLIVNFIIGLSPGIAMEAHIGGLVVGFILGLVFYATMRPQLYRYA